MEKSSFISTEEKLLLASNPHTPSEILDALADDPDEAVRKAVASNLNTSADTLKKIAKGNESYPNLSMAVAENKNTPDEMLALVLLDVMKAAKETNVSKATKEVEERKKKSKNNIER